MIGKVCISVFPFFDLNTRRGSYKTRPMLVIGGPRNNDYTVLPISTVSRKENLDAVYDIRIDPMEYPRLELNKVCYVRTHKQTTVHSNAITKVISDMKELYPDLYLHIIDQLDDYNNKIINDSI